MCMHAIIVLLIRNIKMFTKVKFPMICAIRFSSASWELHPRLLQVILPSASAPLPEIFSYASAEEYH